MKVFVWQELARVTDNYHPGGGLLIVATSLETAKVLAKAHDDCIEINEEPTLVLDLVGEAEPRVMVFQDAGCC